MTEVKQYTVGDLKLTLNVIARRTVQWFVRLNDRFVYGKDSTVYSDALNVYNAVEKAIDIMAVLVWGYIRCEHCEKLVPSIVSTLVWYTKEETNTREGYTESLCEKCIIELGNKGSLKK